MSYLQNAHNFNVNQLSILSPGLSQPNPRDVLHEHIAPGAIHDSAERCDAPKCHPETRKAVQEEILNWITHSADGPQSMNILWLTGPAGSGKTAIAGTIADICEEKHLLAATFFFSSFTGSSDRRSKRYLVATLAYQLAHIEGLESLGERIMAAVERSGRPLFGKHLEKQMSSLILKPLEEMRGRGGPPCPCPTKVIIIDGLDEVLADEPTTEFEPHEIRQENEDDQIEILSLLLKAANHPASPFRILVSSRPEPAIRQCFSNEMANAHQKIFLDNKYNPDTDIELYLTFSFAKIRRRYHLPPSWPGTKNVKTLVTRASGQFIYAATAVRFLQSGSVPPHARLDCILALKGSNAFTSLDALYTHILNSSPEPTSAVQWIALLETSFACQVKIDGKRSSVSALFVRQLLESYPGQVNYVLENLASIIRLPLPEEEAHHSYELYHKSLVEFLSKSQRCGETYFLAYTNASKELLFPRMDQLFKDHSTLAHIPSAGRAIFAVTLLEMMQTVTGSLSQLDEYMAWVAGSEDGSSDHKLASLLKTIFHFASHIPQSRRSAHICMEMLFDWFHCQCEEYIPRKCKTSCELGRSRVLQACEKYGWSTPSPLDLLRHTLVSRERGIGHSHFSTGFILPSDTPSHPVASSVQAAPPVPSNDRHDGGYRKLKEATVALYYQLPRDWDVLFRKSVAGGLGPHSSIVDICRRFGIGVT